MKKSVKIGLGVLAVVSIVSVSFLLSKKAVAKTASGNDGIGTGNNSSGGGSSNTKPPLAKNKVLNYQKVLKRGSGYITNNAEVKFLQNALNNIEKSSPLVIDGMFGPLTEAKLKRINNGFNSITLAQVAVRWYWAIPQ